MLKIACDNSRFKYIYVSCFLFSQVIFGELFQLPTPPHIDVMYTTLLIELCKLQPGSLPQVVSSSVYVVFEIEF